ncbi:MAG: DNA topoisomerase 3 [Opitutales bacterium]|nr:DNA topoisomerase 3 [Opitutales bacterium]
MSSHSLMKTLVIAEKPSVARDIAAALGIKKKTADHFENDDYVVTSAVGHVVELFMPEDIDKKLRVWKMDSLPIIPEVFEVKPIEKTKDVFAGLKKLMQRKDIDGLINACDAGREGELIFTYICQAAGCKKPVWRLWMQSMTKKGILEAFNHLREGAEMAPLCDAARSRSEADWLIGINGTRAVTARMFGSRRGKAATVGRVQTPTLALVVERERAIRNFVPRDYWRIQGIFDVSKGRYEGVYQKPNFKKADDDDRADRLWTEAEALAIVNEARTAEWAEVSEEKKRTRQGSPRLYDLTTLQREANNRYGMPAGATLRAAQSLYEKHKLLTYPRTDARCLPEDYLPVCKAVMGSLAVGEGGEVSREGLARFAVQALDESYVRFDKRIFDNKGISDHFAIIPTEASADGKKLSADEAKIYDMVARRFVAAFYPSAEFDVTTRISSIGEHRFRTEGKVLAVPGWLDVYGRTVGKDELPAISEKDGKPPRAKVAGVESLAEQTRPPVRYTEATLLTAMETAGKDLEDEELVEAMKEKGLGTPATRAQTIDHLINEQYMERQGRDLAPTGKAEGLIDFLNAVNIQSLVSAHLTGDWEYRLKLIEERKLSRDDFMKGIREHAERVVEKAKSYTESEQDVTQLDFNAPSDGQPMLESVRAFRSQDGTISIYKTLATRMISVDEVRELVTKGQVGPLDGFRSKKGKPFSAILKLEEGKVGFVFDNNASGENGTEEGGEALDFDKLTVVGINPRDGTKVYETPSAFASESYLKGDREKGIRIFRTILGKTIPTEEAKKLFADGKTGVIDGFISKRTRRPFKAFLVLDAKKGGISFEFPPREPSKKKTAAKAESESAES